MSGLQKILETSRVDSSLGSDGQADLARRLRSHHVMLTATFVVLFLLLIGLIGFGAYGMWRYMLNGTIQEVVAFSGAVGLSAGSASIVEILRRVWSEWARTGLIIVLVSHAPEPVVNAVVASLARELN